MVWPQRLLVLVCGGCCARLFCRVRTGPALQRRRNFLLTDCNCTHQIASFVLNVCLCMCACPCLYLLLLLLPASNTGPHSCPGPCVAQRPHTPAAAPEAAAHLVKLRIGHSCLQHLYRTVTACLQGGANSPWHNPAAGVMQTAWQGSTTRQAPGQPGTAHDMQKAGKDVPVRFAASLPLVPELLGARTPTSPPQQGCQLPKDVLETYKSLLKAPGGLGCSVTRAPVVVGSSFARFSSGSEISAV